MNPWLVGGGALAVLLLATQRASAATMPSPFTSEREKNLDALADMLITETSFKKSKPEMAAIVHVAMNRARRQKKPIWFVVQPGSGPRPVWNTNSVYRQRFENARNNSRWRDARAFAATVLAGSYTNYGQGTFIHPGASRFNMPCNPAIKAVRDGRWAPSYVTRYGTRCIPKWAHGGKVVGSGLFA